MVPQGPRRRIRPKTWTQMIADANQLAAKGKPHYIEEQGAQYEGLTVWFNSLVDSAGGQILTADNKVVLGSAAAKSRRRSCTSSRPRKGADPSLNVSQEGPGQVAFQSGTAAFMINYPFVWSATQAGNPKVFKDMGYALFPAGHARHRPEGLDRRLQPRRLGLLQHPDLAFQAVQCLIQAEEPEPRRDQGRPRAGRREHLRPAVVRQGVSVPPADQAAAADLRHPPADAGLRGRHARDPEDPVAHLEHQPQNGGQHLA